MRKGTSVKKHNCPFIGFLELFHNFFHYDCHNTHVNSVSVKPSPHLQSILERNETIVVIGLHPDENR